LSLPKGWVISKWSDVVFITHGQNKKGIEDENGAYPIYGSGGLIGKSSQFLVTMAAFYLFTDKRA